ncbi:MAG TPA: hypothetical protein VHR97_04700 [Candidatus Baltobacteraceae bacterium]|jgi:hypothetical protein|nr:hypothetical protein [Candidatus Baltobacteraceae bacterium]
MPESYNVELAHDLAHHGGAHGRRRDALLGMAEAIVLAIVAVATAWSGYQASRWEGISTKHYALYERYTVLAQEKSTLAGQDRLYDIVTFNGWTAAKMAGHEQLAAFYERRFRPEYDVAFKAWWRLDPLHDKTAPPGPIFMPQYKNANDLAVERYENVAADYFKKGVETRDTGDDYVRVTVFLATVLFLTALSQRFGYTGPRAIIVSIATLLLVISMFWIVTLPRT